MKSALKTLLIENAGNKKGRLSRKLLSASICLFV